MLEQKPKRCKGTGIASGHGCGEPNTIRTYGLGHQCRCYQIWLTSTELGLQVLNKRKLSASKKVTKEKKSEWKEQKQSMKSPHDRFYKSTAWKYCSRYVLLFYSQDGCVKCATSGVEYNITDRNIHCGHFIKVFDSNSTNYSTALEFKNLMPQCYRDNVILGGRPDEMAKQIDLIHGVGTIDWLNQKKHESYKLDKYELDMWAKNYKALFNELVKIKGNPWKND